jgi:dTDP-4-amino-4,6-dideoxygalactose transaminase
MMTPFTQPAMPDRRKVDKYLDGIYQSKWLTNNGPLVQELTVRLEEYLGVENLLLVSSGTMGLQIAYRALGITGTISDRQAEVVTTPFTFVATESSLRWEGLAPRFADIRPDTFNLCPEKSAERISANTRAILPVHVYGNPCDVDAFEKVSASSGSKLVYDAAHAFGVQVNGESVLNHGDASVLSFHATKVFHTIEGGGVVFKDPDALYRAQASRNFGFDPVVGEVGSVGINGKMSEVNAAFGLAMLDDYDSLLERRLQLYAVYKDGLPASLVQPLWHDTASQNAAYMPVVFESANDRDRCEAALNEANIPTRRYFSPCLGTAEDRKLLAVASSISERVLCLPLYADMRAADVTRVTTILNSLCRGDD